MREKALKGREKNWQIIRKLKKIIIIPNKKPYLCANVLSSIKIIKNDTKIYIKLQIPLQTTV